MVRLAQVHARPRWRSLMGWSIRSRRGRLSWRTIPGFSSPFTAEIDAGLARRLHIESDQPVVYYPRRGFDIWNTRYFILPRHPTGLRRAPMHGFMSLLEHAGIVLEPSTL